MTISLVVGFGNIIAAGLFMKRCDNVGNTLFWLNIYFAFMVAIVIIGDKS